MLSSLEVHFAARHLQSTEQQTVKVSDDPVNVVERLAAEEKSQILPSGGGGDQNIRQVVRNTTPN